MLKMDNDLYMRMLFLEKEIEILNAEINDLKEKLSANPFTRDSFRPSTSLDLIWNTPIPITNQKEAKE